MVVVVVPRGVFGWSFELSFYLWCTVMGPLDSVPFDVWRSTWLAGFWATITRIHSQGQEGGEGGKMLQIFFNLPYRFERLGVLGNGFRSSQFHCFRSRFGPWTSECNLSGELLLPLPLPLPNSDIVFAIV